MWPTKNSDDGFKFCDTVFEKLLWLGTLSWAAWMIWDSWQRYFS